MGYIRCLDAPRGGHGRGPSFLVELTSAPAEVQLGGHPQQPCDGPFLFLRPCPELLGRLGQPDRAPGRGSPGDRRWRGRGCNAGGRCQRRLKTDPPGQKCAVVERRFPSWTYHPQPRAAASLDHLGRLSPTGRDSAGRRLPAADPADCHTARSTAARECGHRERRVPRSTLRDPRPSARGDLRGWRQQEVQAEADRRGRLDRAQRPSPFGAD